MARRVILLVDRHREGVEDIATSLGNGLGDAADIVGDFDAADEALPALENIDAAIAIGGDGTLISQAVRVLPYDIPLIGVNCGRLGFLAEFDVASLIEHRHIVFGNEPPVLRVMLIRAEVEGAGSWTAMNEVHIAAGDPFRILELDLSIDGIHAPALRGDGIIVATPTGSTAHSVSAGGPIVDPRAQAIVLTPLAAHSLAVRPIVVADSTKVDVDLRQANAGTTLVIDGRPRCGLATGQRVSVYREPKSLRLILNPTQTYWDILANKLHWAAPPGPPPDSAPPHPNAPTP
ncbi:MAG: NAD(+)/NADH kinase [Phycisphaerales bacterium]|jgi:NAD+ kinase|nr:NAD(+)/NADH kinase [Phycisphaerales bacterium]